MNTTMKICSALILLIFLLFAAAGYAQTNNRDSAYIFSLLDKAEGFFIDSKYDSALYYSYKAESISRQSNYKKGLAYSLIKSTEIYLDKEEFERATNTAATINAMGLQMGDSLVAAIGWMQMAQAKMYDNKFTEATQFFTKSLQYYLEKHPTRYSALAYNDLGYTWGRLSEIGKQANCLTRAVSIYENYFPDEYGELGVTYNNLSTVYYNLNDRPKAIEYGKKSIYYREKTGDIKRLALGCCNLSQFYIDIDNQEAKKYADLCIKYAIQSNDETRIIHSYVTASLIASTQKNYKTSIDYELKAVTLLEKANKNFAMLSRRYMALASGYAAIEEDSSLVLGYYNKAVSLSKQINDRFNLRDVYFKLSEYYRQQHQYTRALDAYQNYITYRDSIITEKTKADVAEIETKYQSGKKDKEIDALNAEQKIKQLQIEKQNAIIAGNVLEAQKKESEIELLSNAGELQDLKIQQQDEQLEKQLLLAKNNEQQLQLAEKEKLLKEKQLKSSRQVKNFLLAGIALLALLAYFMFNRYQLKRKIQQQRELLKVRNNIAQDLHDEIGSALTSIKILSQVSKSNLQKDQAKASSFLQKITEQSTEMQQGISDIVWAIKPDNDKLENMVTRMREYVAHTLEPKNIETAFLIDEQLLNKPLNMQQRRDFFLVFKEAVNNIAKYSNCSKAEIKLVAVNNHIQLSISDNGIGFDVNKQTTSNGLKNMKARAEALGGQLSVQSVIGSGTGLQLIIPAT